MGTLYSRIPAISLKRSKIGPKLLLMTNRKSHTRFRLIPKSTTLDDLNSRYALWNTCVFGAHHRNLNEDRPTLWLRRCSPVTLVFKFYADIRGVPWRGGVKRQWGCRKRQFSVLSLAISSQALEAKPTLLSPPSKRSEWRRYCFRSMCVWVC